MQARCRNGGGLWRVAGLVAAMGLLAGGLAAVQAKPKGDNVHRPGAECAACHTAEHATLDADPAAARTTLVVPDIDDRCSGCHNDEGPSHHVGIRPRKPVPDTLPLSGAGLIACSTCHFVHGERNPFGDFLRIDNSRGGLCLTCHELKELE